MIANLPCRLGVRFTASVRIEYLNLRPISRCQDDHGEVRAGGLLIGLAVNINISQ